MIPRLRDISLACLALLSVASFGHAEETKNDYGTVIGIGELPFASLCSTTLFLTVLAFADLGTTYSAVG